MRERLVTLACALGALLLFATLFVRGEGLRPQLTRPTSVERGANGLRGAFLWLQGEGLHPVSLRERFDTLTQRHDLPATGNLLIVTTPVVTPFSVAEAAALEHWLRAGNTLLVLAALSDSPAGGSAATCTAICALLTGLEFALHAPESTEATETTATPAPPPRVGRESDAARRADEQRNARARSLRRRLQLERPARSVVVPNGPHPYLDGVRTAVALSDLRRRAWDVKLPRAGFVMALAHQRDGAGAGALWVRPYGAGAAIVSGFGSLFTNRALGLADNARLLANIVGASVAPGGAVLFDDEHQGLGASLRSRRSSTAIRACTRHSACSARVAHLGAGRHAAAAARRPAGARRARPSWCAPPGCSSRACCGRRRRHAACSSTSSAPCAHAPRQDATGRRGNWLEQHPRLRPADVQQLQEWYAAAYSAAARTAGAPAQPHRQHRKAARRMSASIQELEQTARRASSAAS